MQRRTLTTWGITKRKIGTRLKCGWKRQFEQWGGQLDTLRCRRCGWEISGLGVFTANQRYEWWLENGYLIDQGYEQF
jgi:hypothetical protein